MNLTKLLLVNFRVLSSDPFFSIVSLVIFTTFVKNANVHNFVDDNTFVNHVGSKFSNLKGIIRRNI